LIVVGHNLSFVNEKKFASAYNKGINSGHKLLASNGQPLDLRWRVHICCWAAMHALKLNGDFVECGVNTGIFSLSVCHYLDFNNVNKDYYLFDTFTGIPEEQMSIAEHSPRVLENELMYEDCYEIAKRNFSPFERAHLVKGTVPESLQNINFDKIAYLCLDMNITKPEIDALEFFWDKLVSGALIIFDDYGWNHYREQYDAVNKFAEVHGVMVATLPTGQGLLIKP